MITHIVGNLLDTDKCNVIVHQANLFHTFGGGIAKAIREKFPEAYAADKQTPHGDKAKLGTFSIGRISDKKGTSIEYIINMYSQDGIGGRDRNTRYDNMVDALNKLKNQLEAKPKRFTLGIPFQLGCGLASGSWLIVSAIIYDIFGQSNVPVYIYYLPEFAAQMPKGGK